ncbi:hypothetical protein [Shewanella sp. NIFS-20-20]|uniref:hypothetical protein n=1 Tax=Shewanella sp. NIFS-20-20 TaxID=2853806 RepID=UPI001C449262|nr:hypothetical protein [Shewanella sp. NIFS-20-20]MBV7315911.1 hypothetical protein [Shewanella sp. NIFS-20-20]
MTREEFIDNKAPQLAFYTNAYLTDQIAFDEIQLYLWDTLEEWQQGDYQGEAQSDIEQAFWHLLHNFDKWPDWVLRGNRFLRQQIQQYSDYLSIGGQKPSSCVGVCP